MGWGDLSSVEVVLPVKKGYFDTIVTGLDTIEASHNRITIAKRHSVMALTVTDFFQKD